MFLEFVLLILGLAVLYFGAEAMVKGASQLALTFGISPLIVGLTVVAFGTSAPEFLVSLVAMASDPPAEGISVGKIIGSNICMIWFSATLRRPLTFDYVTYPIGWVEPRERTARSDASSLRRTPRARCAEGGGGGWGSHWCAGACDRASIYT